MRRPIAIGLTLLMVSLTFAAVTQVSLSSHSESGLCREIDPDDSVARGFARAAYVTDNLTGIENELNREESTQQGPGSSVSSNDGAAIQVPPGSGDVLDARTLSVHASGTVTEDPLTATQDGRVHVANVSILGGLVQSSLVRAEGETFAKEKAAFTDSDGSTIGWVIVDGEKYSDVGPNTIVHLDEAAFGEDSRVILFERQDDSSFPDSDHPFYTAELRVRMIHVIITDHQPLVAGDQSLDIVVGEAYAFSEVPTPWCGPHQSVGASAYVGRFRDQRDFSDPGTLLGWLELPPTGGYMEQGYQAPTFQEGDVNISMGHAETRVFGEVDIGVHSKSWSVSKIEDLCIVAAGGSDCIVTADSIRVESQSRAFPDDRFSWAHMRVAGLVVNGEDITAQACPGIEEGDVCNPPRNYEQQVGEYKVILNMRQRDPFSEGHTGYTVRGVWVEGPGLGLHIIGRAYSEASYEPDA